MTTKKLVLLLVSYALLAGSVLLTRASLLILSAGAIAFTATVAGLSISDLRKNVDAPRQRPSRPSPTFLAELREIYKAVDGAGRSGFDADRSLRPLLSQIADARLAKHGIRRELQPEIAEGKLGAALTSLLQSEPTRSGDRAYRGFEVEEIEAMIQHLEAL